MYKELGCIIAAICALVIAGVTGCLSNTLERVVCCFKKVQLYLENRHTHQIEVNQYNDDDYEHSTQLEESELDEVSCAATICEEVYSSIHSGEVAYSTGKSDYVVSIPD